MTIPIWVEQQNGKFTARVLGSAHLTASAETREDAIRAVSQLIQLSVRRGSLVLLEVPEVAPTAVTRPQATEAEIEATREMVAELYRQRDEEKSFEFPG